MSKFYDNDEPPNVVIPVIDILAKKHMEIAKQTTKQSQRLPFWVWFCIAKALGIPLREKDKPIFATILHMLTFGSAVTFVVSQIWFIAYDIASEKTKQDILSGTVSVLIATMWASLGLYAKSLSSRLFRHPRFLKDIRMHARTIFKINAAFLVFLLGLFFIIILNLESVSLVQDQTPCLNLDLEPVVCQLQFVNRVIFSVFSLIWNTLVAIVLISLCRTHTIGIRRFITELERDALMYDHYHAQRFQVDPMTKEDICEETFWLEEDSSFLGEDESQAGRFTIVHRKTPTQTEGPINCDQSVSTDSTECTFSCDNSEPSPSKTKNSTTDSEVLEIEMENCLENKYTNELNDSRFFKIQSVNFEGAISENISLTPHTMSAAEILHKYWKLSCRLRVTSCALQRWMASLIALVIVWCFVYLIHWQDNTPTVQDVLLFVIPLLLLPLLCSAFAEVNMEGNRMVQCVCPTEDRIPVVRFLSQNPLNMMIFGVSMSYGTIMTVVFAIFVAFTSRLIFAEMSKTKS